jgi:hypothetical protein
MESTTASTTRRRAWPWIIGGCLGILVFVVASCSIIGVLAFRWKAEYRRIVGGPDAVVAITRLLEVYASEIGEGDIADQYEDDYLSSRYKAEHPVGDFEAAEANVRMVGNRRVAVGAIEAADSTATASMAVEDKAGDQFTVDFVLVREGGLWRVDDIQLR